MTWPVPQANPEKKTHRQEHHAVHPEGGVSGIERQPKKGEERHQEGRTENKAQGPGSGMGELTPISAFETPGAPISLCFPQSGYQHRKGFMGKHGPFSLL